MKDFGQPPPDCVIFLLAKAYQKGHALMKARLKNFDLTNMQHLVLEAIWYRPGVTASELSGLLLLDKATLSGVLDRLFEKDWIFKEDDPVDKRLVRWHAADRAHQLKALLVEERRLANEELLAPLTVEESILFKKVLFTLFEQT
jgi:DNA-binding MarR family transcriptional regulator